MKKASSVTSVSKAAEAARIPDDAPIILFIGGPGGGKTRYAAKLRDALEEKGLVHICMPDLIRGAIAKYKDRFVEWKDAAAKYQRGELIPNHLAQDLVKAEMGRYPYAKAYFLEGFPREAGQVEDFERNVRPINMALILDYDEETLRRHMEHRGLLTSVIDRRISEFKLKTLPSAKYFDDQRLLHLIPGEKDDNTVLERMMKLVNRAIDAGVNGVGPVTVSDVQSPEVQQERVNGTASSRKMSSGGANRSESQAASSSPIMMSTDESQPVTAHTAANTNGISPTPPSTTPTRAEHITPLSATPKTAASVRPTSRPVEEAIAEPTTSSPQDAEMMQRRPSAQSLARGTPPVSSGKVDSAKKSPSAVSTPKSRTASRSLIEVNGKRPSIDSNPGAVPVSISRPGTRTSAKAESVKSAKENIQEEQANAAIEMATPKATPTPKEENAPLPEPKPTPSSVLANPSDRFPKGLPSNAPVVLIIGAPGSNKSPFAQRIAKKYDGFVHISMGDLFRRKVLQNQEDELWTRIGKKMDLGELIPMKICRELLYTALHEIGTRSWGYVIDGYPRTLPQAEDIENQLGRLDLAILIDCTEQYCKDNLKKRYLDGKEEGSERGDDEEGIVKIRLGLFKQNTLPMLKYLDDKGKLRVVRIESSARGGGGDAPTAKIEGDGGSDKVFQEITNAIDNALFIDDGGSGKSINSSKHASVVDSPIK
ncbi:adenylate kinase domain-containing protein [Ditylenchus destructor]|nr:adenylate kinase domain-containing protein [Ditylenchus destructor]